MRTIHNLAGYLNILLSRHKYQNVPKRERQMDLKYLLDGAVNVILTRRLGVEDFNREGSTRDGEDRSVAIKVGEFLSVHCGGGNN